MRLHDATQRAPKSLPAGGSSALNGEARVGGAIRRHSPGSPTDAVAP